MNIAIVIVRIFLYYFNFTHMCFIKGRQIPGLKEK